MSTTAHLPEARSAPEAPAPADATEAEATEVAPRRQNRALMYPVAAVCVLAGLAAAGTGFALSYGALHDAAVAWGFPQGWQAHAFPIGVDGLIIALYTADLVLAWRQMSRPWVRVSAHMLTAVTIALNISAAAAGIPSAPGLSEAAQEHPGRLLAHAMMPIAYVILTEVARWAIVRTARLESGTLDDQPLTLADWAMNPRVAAQVFRYAKTWPATYAEARAHVRELAIYRVWQEERSLYATGLPAERAAVLDRMPARLAPYGVSVDEARAIPGRRLEQEREQAAARQRADAERERRQTERERQERQERERQEREDAHRARMETLEQEAEATRHEGELAALRATVDGETRAAAHRAEADAATAGIEAEAARTAAERAATEAARRADAEEQAEETARTAALRRSAAEDAARTTRAEADRIKAAADLADAEARSAEAAARTARARRDDAEATERAEAAADRTVHIREEAAAARLRLALAEDALGLSERDRRVRQVAWTIATRAGGDPAALPLYEIETALGVTNGAASGYRRDAGELLAGGYDHQTDPLHAAYQAVHNSVMAGVR